MFASSAGARPCPPPALGAPASATTSPWTEPGRDESIGTGLVGADLRVGQPVAEGEDLAGALGDGLAQRALALKRRQLGALSTRASMGVNLRASLHVLCYPQSINGPLDAAPIAAAENVVTTRVPMVADSARIGATDVPQSVSNASTACGNDVPAAIKRKFAA
jgi:hypothetical protein